MFTLKFLGFDGRMHCASVQNFTAKRGENFHEISFYQHSLDGNEIQHTHLVGPDKDMWEHCFVENISGKTVEHFVDPTQYAK